MNDKIGNRTYLALKHLYLNSIDIQNKTERTSYPLHYLAHAKEYCTIKIATARGAGHSSAIARFVNEYNNKRWAIISYGQHAYERVVRLIEKYHKGDILKITASYIEFKNGRIDFMTSHTFNPHLRGLEVDGIIVDCACLFSQSKIEEIYEIGMGCMARKPQQFFIFVE